MDKRKDKETRRVEDKEPAHPMQPLVVDRSGVVRFKRNAIIDWLFTTGRLDLNEIARMGREVFPCEDHEQLAQLLGYSVSGFSELSYARLSTMDKVEAAEAALKEVARG